MTPRIPVWFWAVSMCYFLLIVSAVLSSKLSQDLESIDVPTDCGAEDSGLPA